MSFNDIPDIIMDKFKADEIMKKNNITFMRVDFSLTARLSNKQMNLFIVNNMVFK